jgi:hypothetical protein
MPTVADMVHRRLADELEPGEQIVASTRAVPGRRRQYSVIVTRGALLLAALVGCLLLINVGAALRIVGFVGLGVTVGLLVWGAVLPAMRIRGSDGTLRMPKLSVITLTTSRLLVLRMFGWFVARPQRIVYSFPVDEIVAGEGPVPIRRGLVYHRATLHLRDGTAIVWDAPDEDVEGCTAVVRWSVPPSPR